MGVGGCGPGDGGCGSGGLGGTGSVALGGGVGCGRLSTADAAVVVTSPSWMSSPGLSSAHARGGAPPIMGETLLWGPKNNTSPMISGCTV
jgi:hypothetical protein